MTDGQTYVPVEINVQMFIYTVPWSHKWLFEKYDETYSMDFHTQLVTLKGWKKQFENLWADF